jgi:hypothetical protein
MRPSEGRGPLSRVPLSHQRVALQKPYQFYENFTLCLRISKLQLPPGREKRTTSVVLSSKYAKFFRDVRVCFSQSSNYRGIGFREKGISFSDLMFIRPKIYGHEGQRR